MLILCQSSSSHSYNIVAASISGNGLKFLWHFKASPHLNLLFWTARHVVVILSLLLSINKKSASCENVNKPRLHWCDRCMWAHTVHADGALKAVSLVRPSLSFLSVNQYLLTKRAPSPTTSTSPAEGKGKSMVPVSTDWQGRQRHVNHSSQAMADFPGHRSEKIFIKLITAWLVITSGERGEVGNERHVLICVSLARCHLYSYTHTPHSYSLQARACSCIYGRRRGEKLQVTCVLNRGGCWLSAFV